MRDVSPLQDLLCLKKLNLEGSDITSVGQLQPILENCKYLRELDIRESQLCKMPKHREHITLLSENLSMLNHKEIRAQERPFLIELQMRRMNMNRQRAAAAAGGGGPGGGGEFEGAPSHQQAVGGLKLQRQGPQGPRGGKVLSGKVVRKGQPGGPGQGGGEWGVSGESSQWGAGESSGVQWGAGFPAHVR